MALFIAVQQSVHARQNKMHDDSKNSQAEQETEYAFGAQILLLELGLRVLPVFDVFFTHVPIPDSRAYVGRAAATVASVAGCGRTMPARNHQSRTAKQCPTRSRGIDHGRSVQSSRTDPRRA